MQGFARVRLCSLALLITRTEVIETRRRTRPAPLQPKLESLLPPALLAGNYHLSTELIANRFGM